MKADVDILLSWGIGQAGNDWLVVNSQELGPLWSIVCYPE